MLPPPPCWPHLAVCMHDQRMKNCPICRVLVHPTRAPVQLPPRTQSRPQEKVQEPKTPGPPPPPLALYLAPRYPCTLWLVSHLPAYSPACTFLASSSPLFRGPCPAARPRSYPVPLFLAPLVLSVWHVWLSALLIVPAHPFHSSCHPCPLNCTESVLIVECSDDYGATEAAAHICAPHHTFSAAAQPPRLASALQR